MMTVNIDAGPRIVALTDKYVPGGSAAGCEAVTIADALTREWPTDVHLSMYEAPTPLMRLRHDLMPPTANVVLLMADVDGPNHGRTAEWDASFRERAAHLPGDPFVPWTRGGARIIYTRELEVTDPEAYTREVLLDLVAIYAVTGIMCDPVCSDITRKTRAPHATRDGVLQTLGWVRGHAARPGPWVRPPMTEAEILTALGSLSAQSKAWRSRAFRFAPKPEAKPFDVTHGDGAKALQWAATTVAGAGSGHRNEQLFGRTKWLASIVAAGQLTADEVTRAMVDAGTRAGLNEREARRTVRSALEASQ